MSKIQIKENLKDCQCSLKSLHSLLCVSAYRFLNDLELAEAIVLDVYLDVKNDKITFDTLDIAMTYLLNIVKIKSKAYARDNNLLQIEEFAELSKDELEKVQNEFTEDKVIIVNSKVIDKVLNSLPPQERDEVIKSIGDYS